MKTLTVDNKNRQYSPAQIASLSLVCPAGPVCMEKGFATLPVNSTQTVATVAVRIWFGSHA